MFLAITNQEIIDYLLKFEDLLKIAKFWNAAARDFGFMILKGIGGIVDLLSGSLKEVYSLINFYDSEPVKNFIAPYVPVFWGLMALALGFLGFQMIVLGKSEISKYITNTLVAITIFFVMPWAMDFCSALVTNGVALLTNQKSSSLIVFQNNITDVYTIDRNGWDSREPANDIKSAKTLEILDISEVVDTGNTFWFDDSPLTDKGKDILKLQLRELNGEQKLAKLDSHFIATDDAYFRYSWHPFFILVELVTKGLVYFFALFKTAKIIMEIGILNMVLKGVSLTGIGSSQRNMQMVIKIRDSFIVLYLVMFLINTFDLWSAYVGSSSVNVVTKMVLVFAGGWLTVDGPNFVEQLFGIDAGLSSISRGIIGTVQGARGVSDAVKGGSKLAKSAASTAVKGGKFAGKTSLYGSAAAKGALDGFKGGGISANGPEGKSIDGKGNGNTKTPPTPTKPNNMNGSIPNTVEKGTQVDKGLEGTIGKDGMEGKNNKDTSGNSNTNATSSAQINNDSRSNPINAMAKQSPSNKKSENNPSQSSLESRKVNAKQQMASKFGANKAQQALSNGGQGTSKNVNEVPRVGGSQLPKPVQQAKENLVQGMQPREKDTSTLGEKAVQTYAESAQKVYDGKTARTSRKVYDVSKATAERVKGGRDK